MTWQDQMMRVVRESIDRMSLTAAGAAGTVSAVDASRLSATVVVDGSTVGVPVKVAGHVWPVAGDRVALLRVGVRRRPGESYGGEEWCVVGVTSRPCGPNTAMVNYPQVTGTTVTTTVTDIPGSPSFTFTKQRDSTPLAMYACLTAFVNGTSSNAACHLGFTDASGTQTRYRLADVAGSVSLARFPSGGWRQIPDAVSPTPLAAGPYTVNIMWARSKGTGTVTCGTADDHASAIVIEMGS